MKLLQVYNDYRSLCGGEATVVQMIGALMEKHGHTARLLTRSSKGLDRSLGSKVRGFLSGIYSFRARREMAELLAIDRPDVVHVHNLYPLFSPSVLLACRQAGVPVVMTSHNYMLTCPVVNHLHKGQICEKCLGGKEYWCILQNCRENLGESVAYAVRSATAQRLRLMREPVTIHIVLSDFARRRLLKEGYRHEQVEVLPNMVELGEESSSRAAKRYVAYSGRLASEKGVDVLLRAAAQLSDIPFQVAGDGPAMETLRAQAPPNVQFVGRLSAAQMHEFYDGARFLVVPSKWFEGCPLVVSEAMSRGLPVIASRIGGLPEFVEDGKTGLLFEPANDRELATKIQWLWERPDSCRSMGQSGRRKAVREYSPETYYQRLMAIYQKALSVCERHQGVAP